MNKIFITCLIAIQFSCIAQNSTDNKLLLKIQYTPETNYTQTTNQTSDIEIKYSGTKDFLQQLSDKGVQNPTIQNLHTTIESVFKTGKLNDAKVFPLTVAFIKTSSNNKNLVVPNGTIIYGHGTINNTPTFDSLASDSMELEAKTKILQFMQSAFFQITFPEKTMTVGESFSQETQLSIPIGGLAITAEITTNYKLLSIYDGMAKFAILQAFKFKPIDSKYDMDALGSGQGDFYYDISNNYYTNYKMDTEIRLILKMDAFDLDVTSKSKYIQNTSIKSNKNVSR